MFGLNLLNLVRITLWPCAPEKVVCRVEFSVNMNQAELGTLFKSAPLLIWGLLVVSVIVRGLEISTLALNVPPYGSVFRVL